MYKSLPGLGFDTFFVSILTTNRTPSSGSALLFTERMCDLFQYHLVPAALCEDLDIRKIHSGVFIGSKSARAGFLCSVCGFSVFVVYSPCLNAIVLLVKQCGGTDDGGQVSPKVY